MKHYFIVVIFILFGLTSLWAAIADADWFFNSGNARPMVKAMGRKGARLTYGGLGLLALIFGLYIVFKQ